MAEKFASYTKGNAHIFILGRNRVAAEEMIARFLKPSAPGIVHEFIHCDATLISNINAASESILARFNKINFVVLSCGALPPTMGRNMTKEGLERSTALFYYSKWTLINNLIPALLRAKEDGEMAKVYAVAGAGRGDPIDFNDLGVKRPDFSFMRDGRQLLSYLDVMVEDFAARYPTLSICHVDPGPVATNLYKASEAGWVFRTISRTIFSVTMPFITSASDSGEYLLCALLTCGSGAHKFGPKGDELEGGDFATVEERAKLWDHTVKELNGIAL
ncbi:hypothetical protein C8J56DRAFT_928976 [Mycena floridula]|nr:hypothetical protein C8J56DRAFT_928976 [Mycena floridula]